MLPFENLSEEKANAFFASGIQDEILTALAKISGLKVVSRTSTARYQSSPENLAEVAKQLGVAHILEGSVQKAADRFINVQLIRADNDARLRAKPASRFGICACARIGTSLGTMRGFKDPRRAGAEDHLPMSQPMSSRNFFTELKRRNVYNVRAVAGS